MTTENTTTHHISEGLGALPAEPKVLTSRVATTRRRTGPVSIAAYDPLSQTRSAPFTIPGSLWEKHENGNEAEKAIARTKILYGWAINALCRANSTLRVSSLRAEVVRYDEVNP